jgi:hypothetical protein
MLVFISRFLDFTSCQIVEAQPNAFLAVIRLFFTETQLYFECNTLSTSESLAPLLEYMRDNLRDISRFVERGIFSHRSRNVYNYLRD